MHYFFCQSVWVVRLLSVTLMLLAAGPVTAQAADFWLEAKKPGRVILMRHALAPGGGDPSEFTLGECATQRNLDAAGREQARDIGRAFRNQSINGITVYTSEWCRCVDTAQLLNIGPVIPQPMLNSFFRQRDKGPDQTAELLEWLAERGRSDESLSVLVTHQVNITAASGVYPSSGEMILVELEDSGTLTVVARLVIPPS